nr:retrovirus-related Pol polyprotein from transposon TNT 1-94 [Tanacetum cinerariifolium]
AEYIATAEASMEAVWMRKFIDGLGNVVPSNKRPMEMLCENEHPIAIANDLGILKVKENQEKDKIESKPDKNRKRGEAKKSLKQLQ